MNISAAMEFDTNRTAVAVLPPTHEKRSAEMSDVDNRASPESIVPTHPEEVKATYELRLGKLATIQASARITPAGIIATGITICAVALAIGYASALARRGR